MPSGQAAFACCDRCANLAADSTAGAQRGHLTAGAGATAATATVARRRILKAAVVRPQPDAGTDERLRTPSRTARRDARVPAAAIGHLPPSPRAGHTTGFADVSQLPRTVFGIIQDVSPQVLVLGEAGREQRFALTGDAVGWRGSQLEPAALRQGDHAVVRLHSVKPQHRRPDLGQHRPGYRHHHRAVGRHAGRRRGRHPPASGRHPPAPGGRPHPGPVPDARARLPRRHHRAAARRRADRDDPGYLAACLSGPPAARPAADQRARARFHQRLGDLARAARRAALRTRASLSGAGS